MATVDPIVDVRTRLASRLHDRHEQWFTDRVRVIKADACIVEIETESGLVGQGEASPYGHPAQIADWVTFYKRLLVGSQPDDDRTAPRPTGLNTVWAVGSAHDYAAAGIDCALWDLRGKQHTQPVSGLLTGAPEDSVEVYASSGVRYDWRGDREAVISDVAACAAQGYKTVKIRLGTAWHWDDVTAADFVRLLDKVRNALPEDVALAVDGNSRLSREQALHVGHGLDEIDAAWFEEPMPIGDIDGYRDLASALSTPLSGGESFTTVEQFRPYLEEEALAIVQPDAGMCGVTELMKIGAVAQTYGARLIPHSWHNGLMAVANAHAVAALPNAPLLEECMVQGPLKWEVLQGGSQVREGRLSIRGPGFGVSVSPSLEQAHPFVEGQFFVEVHRAPRR